VLCAVPAIDDDFVVINADDFYGYDAFKTAAEFLKRDKTPAKHAVIGYQAANTIGDNGTVKRGICSVDESGKLLGICESLIDKDDSGVLLAARRDVWIFEGYARRLAVHVFEIAVDVFLDEFTIHFLLAFAKILLRHQR
ncbi:MAG: hypothetical protein J6U57_05195, partial [Bacteroidales bacterium]|nr:hypothetical protein [Bacteroidales bacterium]